MGLTEYITYFLQTDTPFMLLFIALFFYVIKSNNEREKRITGNIVKRLETLEVEMKVLINVWKILLEKELEEKKNE